MPNEIVYCVHSAHIDSSARNRLRMCIVRSTTLTSESNLNRFSLKFTFLFWSSRIPNNAIYGQHRCKPFGSRWKIYENWFSMLIVGIVKNVDKSSAFNVEPTSIIEIPAVFRSSRHGRAAPSLCKFRRKPKPKNERRNTKIVRQIIIIIFHPPIFRILLCSVAGSLSNGRTTGMWADIDGDGISISFFSSFDTW